MFCVRKPLSSLELYAKSLSKDARVAWHWICASKCAAGGDNDSPLGDCFIAQAAPMLFPMYTVPVDVLLRMTNIEPHETLKAAKNVM